MTIDREYLKNALGDKFDPKGDYVVCGYNDLAIMKAKGYTQVGTIQDPSPEDREMLVFDRLAVRQREAQEAADRITKSMKDAMKRAAEAEAAAETEKPKTKKKGLFT